MASAGAFRFYRVFEDHHSSLGGEHGERIALVNDRFATAFGGDPKDRH
jgi:hypothetical protein